MESQSKFTTWAPVVAVLLLSVLANPTSSWLASRFWMHEQGPGSQPPWYFIGQDLVEGLVYTAALLVAIPFLILVRRRYQEGSWMALWMALLWMGPGGAQAFYVIARSDGLWNADTATTAWVSFDQYLHDPLRRIIYFACLGGALFVAAASRRYFGPPGPTGPD